jgi:hypothetical protein
MAAEDKPELRDPQLSDAVLDALRGALHIVGGMVQLGVGITRLLAATALKAATAVEQAVEATQSDTDASEPKPKAS